MTRRRWLAVPVIACCPLLFLAGCGNTKSKPSPVAVSGTVKLDGKPLPEGTVTFRIAATGEFQSVPVKDGTFGGQAPAGECQVEVSSYTVKVYDPTGMKSEVKENIIPKRFNAETKLTATVTPGGPNQFAFDVTSK